MSINQTEKRSIIKKFGKNDKDTGRTEVQIAILSKEIDLLTSHLKNNSKDFNSKTSLYTKVSARHSLLRYLMKNDIERYRKIVKDLNLRN